MLDSSFQVETPEGIDLPLRPAGLLPRGLAFLIDMAFRCLIFIGLFFILVFVGDFGLGSGLLLLSFFVLNWLYMVLFEVFNQGRSPGKQLLGLKVIHDDGTRIGWTGSLVRNLLRAVDSLPLVYAVGTISSLLHPNFKRLGDIAAGTLVVYQDTPHQRQSLPPGPSSLCAIALSQEEQRAIISFAERHSLLSDERRAEVAEILTEVLKVHPAVTEDELQRIARGILGAT